MKHLKVCKDIPEIVSVERMKNDYERRLKFKDQEIAKLKEELAFVKGKYSGYTKVKPSTIITNHDNSTTMSNTQYISPKLKYVPIQNIEPFVQSTFDANISTYTYDLYLEHRSGIVKHILSVATFKDSDDIINKSLACTNRSMNTFYALVENKKWTKDIAADCIHRYLDTLRPLIEIYWPIFREKNFQITKSGDSDYIKIYDKIHSRLLRMNPGIEEDRGHGFREELVEYILSKIRNNLSI
jgi:hypothetical protein